MKAYFCRLLPLVGLLLWTEAGQASELFSVDYPGATPLYQMNQTNGAASAVGPTGFDGIGDLTSDTRPATATMWGVRIASNELLEIDPLTGAAKSAATMNSPDDIVSLAFDVVTGKLFGNTSVAFGAPFEALYEIDPTTGNTTFVGRILFDNVYALAFDQTGKLFGVSDATDQLIQINTSNGNGSLVAGLATSFAYDIASRPEDDVMFLADSGTSSLYTLNTGTGNLTLVGPYGGSPNLVGLAFSPVPEPSTIALALVGLAGMGLLGRRRAR
ncbi:MAG: PEP-CTERM sorting domain-containing protein [Pirellulales bacterium]